MLTRTNLCPIVKWRHSLTQAGKKPNIFSVLSDLKYSFIHYSHPVCVPSGTSPFKMYDLALCNLSRQICDFFE